MKVLTLLQDKDAALAKDIDASRTGVLPRVRLVPIGPIELAPIGPRRAHSARYAQRRCGIAGDQNALPGKTAVVYGAGGAIGAAASRAVAREGAKVILVGRTRPPLEAVAEAIHDAGSSADLAVLKSLSTLDEAADVAAFLASDRAASMTGTVANLTAGIVLD